MKNWINTFSIFICFFLLFSCLPSKEARKRNRALRKVERARKLSPETFKADTVFFIDTIFVESHTTDTITEIITHDTVTVVNNEKVFLRYYYDTTRLEIWHEVECKSDTVVVTNEVIIEKIVPLSLMERAKRWYFIIPILFIFIILAILFKSVF